MSWHDTNNGSSSVSAVCVSVGASFCVRGSSMPKLARPAMATSIEMAVRIQSYNQRNLSKWIQKPAWLSHFGRFPPTTKNSLKVFRVFIRNYHWWLSLCVALIVWVSGSNHLSCMDAVYLAAVFKPTGKGCTNCFFLGIKLKIEDGNIQ